MARKVGGIWFARLGRVQVSFCICKANPERDAPTIRRMNVAIATLAAANGALAAHLLMGWV